MGEPISMASAAVAATSTAYKISRSLYDFIRSAKKVDTAIELLYTAVVRLEASLKNVDATLKSPGVIKATKKHSLCAGSLNAINCSLQDCEHTLRAFSDLLPENRANQKPNIFKKAVAQFKLDLSQSEMNSLRCRIQDHSTSLQIAMHTLTLDVACQSSQVLRSDLAIGLDTIANIIATINPRNQNSTSRELPSSFVNVALPEHTSSIVATAREVMSTAQSVLSETSSSSSALTFRRKPVPGIDAATSEAGVPITTELRNRIMNWIPSRHSDGNPRGRTTPSHTTETLSTTDSSRTMSSVPLQHSNSKPWRRWTSTIPSSTTRTPSTAYNESTKSGELCDSKDSEEDYLEIEVIGVMFKTGSDKMIESEFADAEGFFSTGLERLRSMTSKTSHRFDLDEQRLWLAYSKLYQGKTDLLLPALQKLYQSSSNALLAVRALHAVAQIHICDMHKSNYELAESACRQVIKDLRRKFGEDSRYHVIHHRSLTLLAASCRLRGDSTTASTYLQLLPPTSHTKKDGNMDDVPEPSIQQIRSLAYRVQAGDKINLFITTKYRYKDYEAGVQFKELGTFEFIVGDPPWLLENLECRDYRGTCKFINKKVLGMRIGEKRSCSKKHSRDWFDDYNLTLISVVGI